MGDMTSEGANISAGIDLSQFTRSSLEEAGENLDNMEQLLLNVNVDAADDEELNAIFRCAHSIRAAPPLSGSPCGRADARWKRCWTNCAARAAAQRRHDRRAAAVGRRCAPAAATKARAPTRSTPATCWSASAASWKVARRRPPRRRAAAAPSAARLPPSPQGAAQNDVRMLELLVGPLPDPRLPTIWWTCSGNHRPRHHQAPSTPAKPPTAYAASRSSRPAATTTCWTSSPSTSPASRSSSRRSARAMVSTPRTRPAQGRGPEQRPGYGFFDDAPGVPTGAAAEAEAPKPAAAEPAATAAVVPATRPAAPKAEAKPAGGGLDQTTLRVSIEKVDQLHQPRRRAGHHPGHAGPEQPVARPLAQPTADGWPRRPRRNTRDLQSR